MVWQINLAVEEVGGGGESLRNVGGHGLVDAGPVRVAIDPLATLCKGGEVEGFSDSIPAEVGQFCAVTESFIQGNILGQEIASHGVRLVRGNWHQCGNAIKFEAVKVAG